MFGPQPWRASTLLPTYTSHSTACVARAMTLAAVIGFLPGAAAADEDPTRRDTKHETSQVNRFCRNFSGATRMELASLHYLLTRDELMDLFALHNEGSCRRWIDEYWRNHDPDLTTKDNEARIEHDRRVDIATQNFKRGEWPGWDQRGEICIRYGMPMARNAESADVIPPGEYVRPLEYWYYPALGMTVQFEDATGSGYYTYFLEHVQLPSWERFSSDRKRMPAGQWMKQPDLDLDRETLDVTHNSLRGGYFGLYGPADQFEYEDFQESLFQFSAVLESTPVVYPFNLESRRVPFEFAAAIFRGGEDVDRVDVNAEFEAEPSTPIATEYRTTAVFFDFDKNEVARSTHTSSVPNTSSSEDSVVSVVVQLPNSLAPGSYEMVITIAQPGTGRFTSERRTIVCDDLAQKPAMSSVCFASRIEPVSRNSAFNRGALEVVPKPSARYSVATSVPVYFEVYNLKADESGAYRYRVSYQVTPLSPAPRGLLNKIFGSKDEAAALASSFASAAAAPEDVVYVFLKTDQLWPGDYDFLVSIVDEVSGMDTSRTGRFTLIE